MSAKILDGRALAARILAEARRRARTVKKRRGRPPQLAVVVASGGPAGSHLKAILRACAATGIEASVHRLSPGPRTKTLGLLADLAADAALDALIVETPYPRGLTADDIAAVVPAAKDAEGVTPAAYGRLFLAKSWNQTLRLIGPCTAVALARLARAARVPLSGRRAVVIGRSATVGRPAAHLLMTLNLTVTIAHAYTRDLAALCREADVLVSAAGVAGLVKPSWIKRGAIVLDAGINLSYGRVVGDVAPGAAARAAWLTPVPGGVGPVTSAVTALQAVILAERR